MSKLNIYNFFTRIFILFYLFFIIKLEVWQSLVIFLVAIILSLVKLENLFSEKINKIIHTLAFALIWVCPFHNLLAFIYVLIIYSLYQITERNYYILNKKNCFILFLFIIVFSYGSNAFIYSLLNHKETLDIFDNLAYKFSLFAGSLVLIGMSYKKSKSEIKVASDKLFSIAENIILGFFILYQLIIFNDLSNYSLILFFLGLILSFFIKIEKDRKALFLLIFASLFLLLMIFNKNNIFTYFIYILLGFSYGLIGFNNSISKFGFNLFNFIATLIFFALGFSNNTLTQNNTIMIVFKIIFCIVSSVLVIFSYNKYIKNLSDNLI